MLTLKIWSSFWKFSKFSKLIFWHDFWHGLLRQGSCYPNPGLQEKADFFFLTKTEKNDWDFSWIFEGGIIIFFIFSVKNEFRACLVLQNLAKLWHVIGFEKGFVALFFKFLFFYWLSAMSKETESASRHSLWTTSKQINDKFIENNKKMK